MVQPDFVDFLSIVLYALFMKNAIRFFEQTINFILGKNDVIVNFLPRATGDGAEVHLSPGYHMITSSPLLHIISENQNRLAAQAAAKRLSCFYKLV